MIEKNSVSARSAFRGSEWTGGYGVLVAYCSEAELRDNALDANPRPFGAIVDSTLSAQSLSPFRGILRSRRATLGYARYVFPIHGHRMRLRSNPTFSFSSSRRRGLGAWTDKPHVKVSDAPPVIEATKPWDAIIEVTRRGRPLDGYQAVLTLTGPRGTEQVRAKELGGGPLPRPRPPAPRRLLHLHARDRRPDRRARHRVLRFLGRVGRFSYR